ncbi:hypothetical protein K491DRAFT_673833 [Lophiostoma macrostomum CBS 122681]|uniref:Uncharacterized protein n=1 Tax=Lophiostoma macrostomum CBS 122681 TaxID=1314788 RepID=A0A6A6TN82_9PLEO|nr:hypothetical protein K491DRAFT_673833 [Lophiostoma macrostomum CBS 122681]
MALPPAPSELERTKDQLQRSQNVIRELQTAIANRDRLLTQHQRDILEKQKLISSTQNTLEMRVQLVADLRAQLARLERALAATQQQLQQVKRELSESLTRRTKDVTWLQEQVYRLSKEKEQCTVQLATNEDTVKKLQKKLKQAESVNRTRLEVIQRQRETIEYFEDRVQYNTQHEQAALVEDTKTILCPRCRLPVHHESTTYTQDERQTTTTMDGPSTENRNGEIFTEIEGVAQFYRSPDESALSAGLGPTNPIESAPSSSQSEQGQDKEVGVAPLRFSVRPRFSPSQNWQRKKPQADGPLAMPGVTNTLEELQEAVNILASMGKQEDNDEGGVSVEPRQ